MFLTVHATAGALIGQYCPNIWLAFIFGIISHYALDAIPHGDETLTGKDKTNASKKDIIFIAKIATLDGIMMSALLLLLYQQRMISFSWPVLAGIAGSIIPDFLNGAYLLTKNKFLEKISLFHFNLHFLFKTRVTFKVGIIVQILILVLLIFLL